MKKYNEYNIRIRLPFWIKNIEDLIDNDSEKPSKRISQMINRYYWIIKFTEDKIRNILNPEEFEIIYDAMLTHAWIDNANLLNKEIFGVIKNNNEIDPTIKNNILEKLEKLEYSDHVVLAEIIRKHFISEK